MRNKSYLLISLSVIAVLVFVLQGYSSKVDMSGVLPKIGAKEDSVVTSEYYDWTYKPLDGKSIEPFIPSQDLSSNLQTFDPEKLERATELVKDCFFTDGMNVNGTDLSKGKVVVDFLNFGKESNTSSTCAWQVTQWGSLFSLANEEHKFLFGDSIPKSRGFHGYRNKGATVAIDDKGELKMEINNRQQFPDGYKSVVTWPHLYLEQNFYPHTKISIAECENIYFSLDAILDYACNYAPKSSDMTNSTIHTSINILVQNRGAKRVSGGPNFFFVQLPGYDIRHTYAKAINAYDKAGEKEGKRVSHALMYGPSGDKFWDGTFKDGKWHKARVDILPIIKDAFKIATGPNTPLEGVDMKNFYITGIIFGWENRGVFDGSMRFNNLSIKAVPKLK